MSTMHGRRRTELKSVLRAVVALAVLPLPINVRPAAAQGSVDPDTSVVQRLEELDQKLRILERLREVERELAVARSRESAVITAAF